MMRRLIAALASLTLLGACASQTATTIAQGMEKVDTDAASAYATVATIANATEAAFPTKVGAAEAIKGEAWSYFAAEHKAYLAGQTYDISALLALVVTIKGL